MSRCQAGGMIPTGIVEPLVFGSISPASRGTSVGPGLGLANRKAHRPPWNETSNTQPHGTAARSISLAS